MSTVDKPSTVRILASIAAAFTIGAFVLGAAWWVASRNTNTAKIAQIADAIAPIAALLSTIALGAAVASVIMQSQELGLQRSELRQAREAQQSLAEESKRANDLAERAAGAQERANELAELAQAEQIVANDVADLANAITLLRARLAIATAGFMNISHDAVAILEGRDPLNSVVPDQAELGRVLRGHVLTVERLHHLVLGRPRPGTAKSSG